MFAPTISMYGPVFQSELVLGHCRIRVF